MAYQESLDYANTIMKNIQLDEPTQIEVREFFQKTISTRQKQEEYNTFLKMIAPSYKLKIQNSIFTDIILQNIPVIRVVLLMIRIHLKELKADLSVSQI